MKHIYFYFILFCFPAFCQKIYENNEPFANRMSSLITTGDSDYFGYFRNFSTLKKNQLAADFDAIDAVLFNLAYGLRSNLEISTSSVIDQSGQQKFNTQYVGVTLTTPSNHRLVAGIDGRLGYNWDKNQLASSINVGIQYSWNKLMVGGSIFANLGKNKILDQITVNTFNVFLNYKLKKRLYLGYSVRFPPRSPFYDYPYYAPLYITNSNTFFVEILFKRSKLSPGLFYQYNRLNYYNKNDFYPNLRYSYLIKKK
jgi:hypothetical protein